MSVVKGGDNTLEIIDDALGVLLYFHVSIRSGIWPVLIYQSCVYYMRYYLTVFSSFSKQCVLCATHSSGAQADICRCRGHKS